MADQHQEGNEAKSCGMFDFLKKKDDEKSQDAVMEKPTFVEKLQRSHSNSSSSSEEEVEGEDGEKKKKKKKKGLKEKIQDKISGEKEEHEVEKHDKTANAEATHPEEEKKGFIEKIKEKLPGHHKKAAGAADAHEHFGEGDDKERKGILEKIKEKLPGHHSENEKAKHKEN